MTSQDDEVFEFGSRFRGNASLLVDAGHRAARFTSAFKQFASPLVVVSLTILVVTAIAAAVPGWLAPFSPYQSHAIDRLQGPGTTYWLGTDELGRDVLSRIIYGARTSVVVGVMSVAMGTGIGALLGLVSGYVGGAVDVVLQRLIDALMSFPG